MKKISSPFDNKENNRSSSCFTARKIQSSENNNNHQKHQQQPLHTYHNTQNQKQSSSDRLESLHYLSQGLDDHFQHIMTKTYELIYNLVSILHTILY